MAKRTARESWRNRIVGHADVAPDQLLAHPLNARRHPAAQRQALDASLDSLGWIAPIVVNRRTGYLIDGHARVEEALSRGEPTVPVVEVDLSEDEERLALATYDPISALATYDAEALDALLAEVHTDEAALQAILNELSAAQPVKVGRTDPDEVPPAPETTTVQRGDVYLLGRHRLMCGDSTSAEDVARLLDGAKPTLMVTDPPYGVEYDPTWRRDAGINRNAKKMGLVSNDDRADWTPAWQLSPADVAYVWHGAVHASTVDASLRAAGLLVRSQIVWIKDRLVLGRGAYHWQHELCWYAVRDGSAAHWSGGRKQTTTWNMDAEPSLDALLEIQRELLDGSTVWRIAARDDSGHGHSTQKPVECMERPIRNHSGDVYEPFSGSGTTLIAAERQNRACYAMEIEPRYVQVAIDRWQDYTGEQAVKVDGPA